MASMPQQRPATSEQVVSTPEDFLSAVERRLRIESFDIDLAADDTNKVADVFISEEEDSLTQPWSQLSDEWLWLNPPYSDIKPWVKKAWEESRNGAKIAVLLPASTGSNWWREWVADKAYITYLNGRIKFVGHKNLYPKDLVLLLYAPYLSGGNCTWRWK